MSRRRWVLTIAAIVVAIASEVVRQANADYRKYRNLQRERSGGNEQ